MHDPLALAKLKVEPLLHDTCFHDEAEGDKTWIHSLGPLPTIISLLQSVVHQTFGCTPPDYVELLPIGIFYSRSELLVFFAITAIAATITLFLARRAEAAHAH